MKKTILTYLCTILMFIFLYLCLKELFTPHIHSGNSIEKSSSSFEEYTSLRVNEKVRI